MANLYVKKAPTPSRPKTTATELVEFVQTYDLTTRETKRALWRLLGRLSPHCKMDFERLRDQYLAEGFHLRDAYRAAVLDVAVELPTAYDLPAGLVDSIRPVPALKEPKAVFKGEGAYAARDAAEAARQAEEVAAQESSQAESAADEARAGVEAASRVRKRPVPRETRFERLLAQVQECSAGASSGIGRSVAWVSANLRTPLERIEAENVPGVEALSLWIWAQQNETEYRRLYDCKRIPTRGIAEDEEKGFIDTGEPIEDIITRIRAAESPQVGPSALDSGEQDVPVRHLQEAEPGGHYAGSQGGVHGLPERSVAGRAGFDSGGGGGPDSGPDGGAGVDIQGSGASAGVGDGDDGEHDGDNDTVRQDQATEPARADSDAGGVVGGHGFSPDDGEAQAQERSA